MVTNSVFGHDLTAVDHDARNKTNTTTTSSFNPRTLFAQNMKGSLIGPFPITDIGS
jgi:hypothetical protein